MLFANVMAAAFLGSVFTMLRFSKYCRLLNQRWKLDEETADRYQIKAQRYLAETGGLLLMLLL